MNEKYMKIAIEKAKKAYKKGEVPIGAVIVYNEKIISTGYNKKEKNKSAINHAEIIAIDKACKKNKNWRLENCTLYVTVEPCMMCWGAIIESRIKHVVYGVKNNYYNCANEHNLIQNNKIKVESNVCEEDCKQMLQDFFKKRRT